MCRFFADRRGQDVVEFIITLPGFLLLILLIALVVWLWYSQGTAAVAINRATLEAAQGGVEEALGLLRGDLRAALGGTADIYDCRIVHLPEMRATAGDISASRRVCLPFLGCLDFTVRARSLWRRERFYGGPPGEWE